MEVRIKEFISGAREAEGLTVIIDVFRAMSVACYAFDNCIKRVIDVATPEEAFTLRSKLMAETILVGERDERRIEGFDFCNSPTEMLTGNIPGKCMIHTTTAGTQGILSAINATEVLGAGLVNARATAKYIKMTSPDIVTLVAMGYRAKETADEDILCAGYIKSIIQGNECDISKEAAGLMHGPGKRFFDAANIDFSPPTDFFLCTEVDRFSFILKAIKTNTGFCEIIKVEMNG